jgi:hypothetical protein
MDAGGGRDGGLGESRGGSEVVNFSSRPLRLVGTWLSLVEHSLGVRGVGSSNLPVPTISGIKSLRDCLSHRGIFARVLKYLQRIFTPSLRFGVYP